MSAAYESTEPELSTTLLFLAVIVKVRADGTSDSELSSFFDSAVCASL